MMEEIRNAMRCASGTLLSDAAGAFGLLVLLIAALRMPGLRPLTRLLPRVSVPASPPPSPGGPA